MNNCLSILRKHLFLSYKGFSSAPTSLSLKKSFPRSAETLCVVYVRHIENIREIPFHNLVWCFVGVL